MEIEILETLMANWDVVLASALAVTAGADKIFLVLITTMGNIRDAWNRTFPKDKP